MGMAIDTIPGYKPNLILHAGPPITWDRMCGPTRGAVMGALIYEGLAKDEKEAEQLAASGKIEFAPAITITLWDPWQVLCLPTCRSSSSKTKLLATKPTAR